MNRVTKFTRGKGVPPSRSTRSDIGNGPVENGVVALGGLVEVHVHLEPVGRCHPKLGMLAIHVVDGRGREADAPAVGQLRRKGQTAAATGNKFFFICCLFKLKRDGPIAT